MEGPEFLSLYKAGFIGSWHVRFCGLAARPVGSPSCARGQA